MYIRILLFLIFQLVLLVSFGQKTYTLNDLIEAATNTNPDLQLQNLKTNRASEILRFDTKYRFPTVDASFSNSMYGGRNIDPFTNTFIQQGINSNNYGLSSSYALFNGYEYKFKIEKDKINVKSELENANSIKKDIKLQVVEYFMKISLNKEILKIQEEKLAEFQKQIILIDEKIKEGITASIIKVDWESKIAQTQFDIQNLKADITFNKQLLTNLTGLKQDFEIKEDLSKIKSYTNIPKGLNPRLRIINLNTEQYKLDLEKSKFLNWPKLNASVGIGSAFSSAASKEFNYFRQLNYNFNQYLSLNLTIPIYTNGATEYAKNQANIGIKISQKEYEVQEWKINQERENKFLELILIEKRISFAKTNLDIQEKLYEGFKARYKEGIISTLEVSTQYQQLISSKMEYVKSQIEKKYKELMLVYFDE